MSGTEYHHMNPAAAQSPVRPFSHPDARLPLPGHMKAALAYCNNDIGATLDKTIRDLGYDRAAQGHDIIIAYPHKHPDRQHRNDGLYFALAAEDALKKHWPETRIVLAHALYETVHLDRSGNFSSHHALTGRQHFAIDPALQDHPLPFLRERPAADKPALFVIVDDIIEQGTTIANMASFVTHNGGTLLGALTSTQTSALQQIKPSPHFFSTLEKPFDHGFLPTLATWFAEAAQREKNDYTPTETMILLEEALKPHGRSLLTLTQGECNSMSTHVVVNKLSPFLRELGMPAERQDAIIRAVRHTPSP